MSEKWGVGGIGVTIAGEILLFPPNPENAGKLEKIEGNKSVYEDIEYLWESFGGAVDAGDWVGLNSVLQFALIRESLEERGVDLSPDQLTQMTEGFVVEQHRENRDVSFLVACFIIRLNQDQEHFLRDKGATVLTEFKDLRPRDREMVRMYKETIGIPVEIQQMVYA